jgi:outer membrane lipoprotein LolB
VKAIGAARGFLFSLAVLALFGLPGCAAMRREPAGVAEQQRALVDRLGKWKLEGRIAVRTTQDAWQANLVWEHDGKQDRLRVSGPLNQGMVSIVLQEDLIFINEGNGVERVSRDPDALLTEKLGFSVPLANLRYWILGVPAPFEESTAMELDPAGRLRHLRQSDWSLDFERYGYWDGISLPQKILIRNSELRIKLFADEWTIEEA